jgi:hypothetical protein
MMLRRPTGGKQQPNRPAKRHLREAPLCRCPVSCTEACRAASAQQGFSRVLVLRARPSAGLEPSSRHGTLIAR